MITVIDAMECSNLASVGYALERLKTPWQFSSDPEVIKTSRGLILPGVGSARNAMENLRQKKLDRLLPSLSQPVLGICLGMQLLFDWSEEGDTKLLGIIPGKVRRIQTLGSLRIPHMGWNQIQWEDDCNLGLGIPENSYGYFVHSFGADKGPWVRASCNYSIKIPAVVQQNNFYGCQFHPERSAATGAQILENFIKLTRKP